VALFSLSLDILTHTLSGMAAGTVCASLSKRSFGQRALIVLAGTVAGVIPDLDVISLWSGFDETFGKWFGVSVPGREIYFGKFWYSHHAITHSIFGSVVCSLFLALLMLFRKSNRKRFAWIYPISFFLGYQMHLWGDTPTPGSRWEGIMYWYPSSEYIGGWGLTWWWNNYDVFLLLALCIVLNWFVAIARNWIKITWIKFVPTVIFSLCVLTAVISLLNRGDSFNYESYERTSFRDFEQRSLDRQREILGEDLYQMMRNFDESINLNF